MMKRSACCILGIVALTLVVCGSSFALDVPANVTKDQAMADAAFALATQQYTALKDQLTAMAAAQNLPPDQQAALDQVITLIDGKLANLDHIEIYFANEATPGEAYDSIYEYYASNGVQFQNVGSDEVLFAVTQLPPGMIPEETVTQITALANDGKIKGATGGSGKSRINVLTVYVNPQTMQVIEGTTIVIAVNK